MNGDGGHRLNEKTVAPFSHTICQFYCFATASRNYVSIDPTPISMNVITVNIEIGIKMFQYPSIINRIL